MAADRSLVRLLLVVLAVALAILWLFGVLADVTTPAWAPPSAALALAVAVLL